LLPPGFDTPRLIDEVHDGTNAISLRKKICITGGPCAGKTTLMASVTAEFINYGIKVYTVPEAATLLMKGGAFIASGAFTPL